MKKDNRYPKNWSQIALQIKQNANWTCARCGKQCINWTKPKHQKNVKNADYDPSLKAQLTLTVHHADYDPANNDPSNLIPLCTACHLWYHRGRKPNVDPNQLKLDLGI